MTGLKRLKHRIEYVFVFLLSFIIERMAFAAAGRAGGYFGLFIYYFAPVRKKTSVENITAALGLDEKKARAVARDAYRSLTRGLFEFEAMGRTLTGDNIDRIVHIPEIELLRRLSREKKGVIFLTAHIGNWHLMDYALALAGLPLTHILKAQHNPYVFSHLTTKMKVHGKDYIILQRTPKNILRALGEGRIVEFLCDQDAGPEGMFVDFFGKKASTVTGPAIFHKKLRLPLVFAYDVYENGRHNVSLSLYERYAGDTADIVRDYTSYFENVIRRYPGQYFWLHKRWNTRPPAPRSGQII